MPTYDYRCEACGHEFDELQSFSEPVLKKCPKCGKLKLRRLIGTGAAVLFKGSGFYETDYRSDSYKSAAKADAEAGTKSESAPAAKTDAGGKADTSSGSTGEKKASGKPKSPKSGS
jgi:putative FmdB family regulatory protein